MHGSGHVSNSMLARVLSFLLAQITVLLNTLMQNLILIIGIIDTFE